MAKEKSAAVPELVIPASATGSAAIARYWAETLEGQSAHPDVVAEAHAKADEMEEYQKAEPPTRLGDDLIEAEAAQAAEQRAADAGQ